MRNNSSQFINIARICLFAGAALWLFGGIGHTYDLFRYYNSKNWSRINVKIIESNLSGYGRNIKTCSQPNIKYEYHFDGIKKISNKWGFSNFGCSTSSFASSIVDKYRVGSEHSAYINPETGLTVLDNNLTALWLATLMGLICYMLIWFIRPKNKQVVQKKAPDIVPYISKRQVNYHQKK